MAGVITLIVIGYLIVGIFVEMFVQPIEWNDKSVGIIVLWPLFALGSAFGVLKLVGYLKRSMGGALELLVKGK